MRRSSSSASSSKVGSSAKSGGLATDSPSSRTATRGKTSSRTLASSTSRPTRSSIRGTTIARSFSGGNASLRATAPPMRTSRIAPTVTITQRGAGSLRLPVAEAFDSWFMSMTYTSHTRMVEFSRLFDDFI